MNSSHREQTSLCISCCLLKRDQFGPCDRDRSDVFSSWSCGLTAAQHRGDADSWKKRKPGTIVFVLVHSQVHFHQVLLLSLFNHSSACMSAIKTLCCGAKFGPNHQNFVFSVRGQSINNYLFIYCICPVLDLNCHMSRCLFTLFLFIFMCNYACLSPGGGHCGVTYFSVIFFMYNVGGRG